MELTPFATILKEKGRAEGESISSITASDDIEKEC